METDHTSPSGAEPTHAPTGLSAGQIVGSGRFQLVSQLGRGGMGVVWLAHDARLNETLALKFLPPEIGHDAAALDDMRRETLKSRKLTHPNIIRIHDFHEAPGEAPFISMEHVDGRDLNTLRVERAGRVFTWEEVAPLARQLCDALDYAHTERVVHRDLKPGNMMIDSRGRLKLADFGIAATISDSVSRTSLRSLNSGTIVYMSPQQMDGETPHVTDDIYALGATLYELLTGKPPFHSGDIAHQVRNLPPKPLEERLAELGVQNPVPPAVAAMVMACLAKDPAHRPQSARAVAEWIGLSLTADSGAAALVRDASCEPQARPIRDHAAGRIARVAAVVCVVGLAGWAAWLLLSSRSKKSSSDSGSSSSAPAMGEYETLFNGRDLAGWTYSSNYWSVENGRLIGRTRGESSIPPGSTSWLEWKGSTLDDFEIKLVYRLSGVVAPVVNYRVGTGSRPLGHFGNYTANLNVDESHPAGSLYGSILSRMETNSAGIRTGRTDRVWLDESRGTNSTAAATEAFHTTGWNELVIEASGGHLRHTLNQRVIVDHRDDDPARRSSSGRLVFALLVRAGRLGTIEISEVKLKRGKKTPPPAPTPSISGPFVKIFNGRDLTGWSSGANYWSVTNGMLVGVAREQRQPTGQTSLFWISEVGDFELKLTYRVLGDGWIRINYRQSNSRVAGQLISYTTSLADTRSASQRAGAITGVMSLRPRAEGGHMIDYLDLDGPRSGSLRGDTAYRAGDWNELHIIAKGERLEHRLNGRTVAEFTDTNTFSRIASGRLYLLMPMTNAAPLTVEIRDVQLKREGLEPAPTTNAEAPKPLKLDTAIPLSFLKIFNGRDLTGFSQTAGSWSVENGAIVGKIGSAPVTTAVLSSTTVPPPNFELKLTYRLLGTGPAYLEYRRGANREPGRINGYGVSLNHRTNSVAQGAGSLFAKVSGFLTNRTSGKIFRSSTSSSVGATYRRPPFHSNDWNELIVSATGPRLIHKVNGTVTVDFLDGDQARRATEGYFELALPPTKDEPRNLQIRDIQLRRLP